MTLIKRLILAALVIVFLIYGVMFAFNNNQTVELNLWFITLPPIWLSAVIMGAFVAGGVLGLVVSVFSIVKSDTQKRILKRKVTKYEKDLEYQRTCPRGVMELLFTLFVSFVSFFAGYVFRRLQGDSTENNFVSALSTHELEERAQLVLAGQNEADITRFVDSLELNQTTLSLHMSIASHFRKSGEVEKSILIRKNIIEHPELSLVAHEEVTFELAKDYLSAGLLDRAEALFKELLTSATYRKQAIFRLVTIYQQQKDWDQAIRVGEMREVASDKEYGALMAHFECEKAEEHVYAGRYQEAKNCLEAARRYIKWFPRSILIELDIAIDQGEKNTVLALFQRTFKMKDRFLTGEMLKRLDSCLSIAELRSELIFMLKKYSSTHEKVCLPLAECYLREKQPKKAMEILIHSLNIRPSIEVLLSLVDCLEINIGDVSATEFDRVLKVIGRTVKAGQSDSPRYRCETCGFTGKKLHWLCPSCKNWGTVKPAEILTERTSADVVHTHF